MGGTKCTKIINMIIVKREWGTKDFIWDISLLEL